MKFLCRIFGHKLKFTGIVPYRLYDRNFYECQRCFETHWKDIKKEAKGEATGTGSAADHPHSMAVKGSGPIYD